MANEFVRVYVKQQLRVDLLNFNQRQMLQVGTVGVNTVKNRVQQGLDTNDAKAKPLTKAYAIRKSKKTGGRAIRDLTLTGLMIDNFSVRTVSDNKAVSGFSTSSARTKARANNRTQLWIAYSSKNVADTIAGTKRIFEQKIQGLAKTKSY